MVKICSWNPGRGASSRDLPAEFEEEVRDELRAVQIQPPSPWPGFTLVGLMLTAWAFGIALAAAKSVWMAFVATVLFPVAWVFAAAWVIDLIGSRV
jgi:hypothetical protein